MGPQQLFRFASMFGQIMKMIFEILETDFILGSMTFAGLDKTFEMKENLCPLTRRQKVYGF